MVLQAKRVLTARKVKALSLDGVNDYIAVPDSPTLNPADELTLIVCVKPLTGTSVPVALAVKYTWWGEYGIMYEANERISVFVGTSNTSYTKKFTSWYAVPYGKISQIALVAKSYDYLKCFINGENVIDTSISVGIGDTTYPLHMGNYGANRLKGFIYYVMLYNKALSDDKISYIYRNPYHPPLSNCVMWLSPESIDENAGIWYDKSGNGNNGTIYGAQAIEMNKLAFSVKTPERVLGAV